MGGVWYVPRLAPVIRTVVAVGTVIAAVSDASMVGDKGDVLTIFDIQG